MSRFVDTFTDRNELRSPQHAFWQAVLLAAVQDAIHGIPSVVNVKSAQLRAVANHRARAYVLMPNADFNQVCHLAGFDPISLREVMTRICAQHPLPDVPSRKRIGRPISEKGAKPKPENADEPRLERTYTYQGETLPLSAWAKRTGLPIPILRNRATKGWSAERALEQPIRVRGECGQKAAAE